MENDSRPPFSLRPYEIEGEARTMIRAGGREPVAGSQTVGEAEKDER